jgi:ferritin-like metal-binding protein YciE
MASLKDLYFDELADLYDAETQMIRTLPRLAEAARAPELREALRKHCDESRLHLERLELIFTHWGERRRVKPCAGLAGIVQEADERLNQEATDDARDAAIIGAAQRIEHYEIAAYGCARTYARRLNRLDEARLLQETLGEEGRTDHRLSEIAEAHINDDARTEEDLQSPPPVGRLHYVPMDVVAQGRKDHEPLPIRNDDEDLGTLDGLVAEGDLGAARYAVVDAGGLLSHRRYLLPLSLLRFDERARVLRVSIDKEVATRYPEFDRDEYQTMSDEDRRGYEARLTQFFSNDTDRTREPQTPVLPDWLVSGTWITVSPARAERLPSEARSFVNEFVPIHGDDTVPARERVAAHDREPSTRRSEPQTRTRPSDSAPIDSGDETPPHGDKLR